MLLFATGVTNAQVGVEVTLANNDINLAGRSSTGKKNPDFLYQIWNRGSVMLDNDSIYRNLDLIYDIAANRVVFKSDKNVPQAFKLQVKEFSISTTNDENGTIETRKFRSGFPTIDGSSAATFYEILSEGKVSLLKRTQIKEVEERAAGSIYVIKQKQPFYSYFLFENNKIIDYKKDKKSLFEAFDPSKKILIESYITDNKIKLKDDKDNMKLFDYYNSL